MTVTERHQVIDISENLEIKQLIDEVFRTRQPKVLRDDETGAEVIVRPAAPRRPRSPRGKPTTAGDSMWRIIGIAKEEQAADVSENHDQYLADAYADTHE